MSDFFAKVFEFLNEPYVDENGTPTSSGAISFSAWKNIVLNDAWPVDVDGQFRVKELFYVPNPSGHNNPSGLGGTFKPESWNAFYGAYQPSKYIFNHLRQNDGSFGFQPFSDPNFIRFLLGAYSQIKVYPESANVDKVIMISNVP